MLDKQVVEISQRESLQVCKEELSMAHPLHKIGHSHSLMDVLRNDR